jgi:hypothetical protein
VGRGLVVNTQSRSRVAEANATPLARVRLRNLKSNKIGIAGTPCSRARWGCNAERQLSCGVGGVGEESIEEKLKLAGEAKKAGVGESSAKPLFRCRRRKQLQLPSSPKRWGRTSSIMASKKNLQQVGRTEV